MSGPMYFNPTAEQVAAAKASNCGMATPKDPSDCTQRCGNYDGKPCGHYRPRQRPHDEAECWPDNHGPLSNLPHDA